MNTVTVPLISVIIPVYNTESLIRKCIDSILTQSYKNLEIIIVNDGSTDNSGLICDELAKEDNRIKVIHTKNQGAAAARKYGVINANGLYISFVDSDDYIDPLMYEHMIEIANETKADMIITNTNTIKNNIGKIGYLDKPKFLNSEEALNTFLLGNWLALWGKLINKELFTNLEWVNLKVADDIVIVAQLIHYSNKIAYTERALYNYIIREGSLTTEKISLSKFDWEVASDWLYKFISRNYIELHEENFYQLFTCKFSLLHRALLANNKAFDEKVKSLINFISRDLKIIIKNKHIPKSRKIASILIFLTRSLYPFLFNTLKKVANMLRQK